ncbi:MAG: choice-of-anchor Q domain-containing protein, partial [Kiritimatiellia bacterium]
VSNAVRLTGDGLVTNTVVVSNGQYVLSTAIAITNPITVRGLSGLPEDVVLDCNYPVTTNRAFYINHAGAVVAGLTVTNGCGGVSQGGGVIIAQGLLTNCVITGCRTLSSFQGGGIYITGGEIQNCAIRGNSNAPTAGGGGIYIKGGLVRDCSITDNTAGYGGGGIYFEKGALWNSLIAGNRTVGTEGGGGIYFRNTLTNNPTLYNCLIVSNYSQAAGGGVYFYSSTTGSVINCTIVSNTAATYAGGLYFNKGGWARNVIVCSNFAGSGASYREINVNGTQYSFTNCCIGYNPYGATLQGTNNLLNTHPGYVNLEAGDFHLREDSPCLNAGVDDAWMAGAVDFDGRHRVDVYRRRVDIGAYEFTHGGTMWSIR